MFLWPIVIVAGIAGAIWYMRDTGRAGLGRTRSRSALNLLEERYARGEIERDEYLQKRRDLEAR